MNKDENNQENRCWAVATVHKSWRRDNSFVRDNGKHNAVAIITKEKVHNLTSFLLHQAQEKGCQFQALTYIIQFARGVLGNCVTAERAAMQKQGSSVTDQYVPYMRNQVQEDPTKVKVSNYTHFTTYFGVVQIHLPAVLGRE